MFQPAQIQMHRLRHPQIAEESGVTARRLLVLPPMETPRKPRRNPSIFNQSRLYSRHPSMIWRPSYGITIWTRIWSTAPMTFPHLVLQIYFPHHRKPRHQAEQAEIHPA
jgi:hypothetical protein